MKRILSVALALALLTSLVSCRENVSARDMMDAFMAEYKISATVFSPSVPEGEPGYVYDGFFELVYSGGEESVADYAAVFLSDTKSIAECAFFLCTSEYDAIRVSEICLGRIEMVNSLVGYPLAQDNPPAVIRRDRWVFMAILDDNARASAVASRILRR